MSVRAAFLLACLFWQMVPRLGPSPRFFRYQRPLVFSDTAASGQSCGPLDVAVFAHASRELADLRLYRGTHETPYVVHLTNVSFATPDSAAALLNLGTQSGHVVFDVHLSQRLYSAVEIVTSAKDFVASVDVSGSQSADMRAPVRLGTFTIFDLTSQQLSRSTVLHLPVSTFPYLHFRITGPLRVGDMSGVTVLASSDAPPVYRTIAESHRVVQQGRSSVITFDIPSGVPVERVTIVPATAGNYSRAMTAEATVTGRPWRSSGGGTFLRVHTVHAGVRIDDEQNSVELHGGLLGDTGAVHWTVTIDNGDDAPLAFQAVRLEMRERTLCFDAQRGVGYTIYYGDPMLGPPHYDYSTLFQGADHPHRVTLGVERLNPGFTPRPDMRPFTERFRWLLWGGLLCAVAVLGGVAVRTAGRIAPREG